MRKPKHYGAREPNPKRDMPKLRKLKTDNRWTMKELAAHVGVSRATLERWFEEDCQ